MPDIYTPRPDIVTSVLKDAGFEAQVQPTIIKDRPADITYRFRGKDYYAEFYVHPLSESPSASGSAFPEPGSLGVGVLIGAALALAILRFRREKRRA